MTKNTTISSETKDSTSRLRKDSLGVAAITFFVISAAAPLTGIAGAFPIAMLQGNGVGLPFDFALITLLLLMFAVGYTRMAHRITNAGAFFAYVSQGLGGVAGSVAAFITLFAYNATQIGLYGLFGAATAGTVESLTGLVLPWYYYAIAAVVVIGVMGYLRIELSARLLAVLVVIEFLVIMILDIAIAYHGGATGQIGYSSFTFESLIGGVPVIGIVLCFASFMGFEAATIYSEEAKHPTKTVRTATYLSILLIGVFFTVTAWMMVEGVGAENLIPTISTLTNSDGSPAPETFIYLLTERFGGPMLTTVISLLFVTSVFAAMQAFHNVIARYFYVLGREGLLTAKLGVTHKRHASPYKGSLLQSSLAMAGVLLFAVLKIDPILGLLNWVTTIGTMGLIVVMSLVSLAILRYFAKHPEARSGIIGDRIFPILTGVAMAVIAVILAANFSVLIGAEPGSRASILAYIFPMFIPLFGLVGLGVGLRLRRTQPERFKRLGETQVE